MVLQGGSEKKGARFCAKGYSGKSELLFRSVYQFKYKSKGISVLLFQSDLKECLLNVTN
jgi:hypothetical protein